MKYTGLALLWALFISACSPSDASLTTSETLTVQSEVRAEFDNLVEAVKTLDHDRYLSFFDPDDFSILKADGTTSNSFEAFKTSYLEQMQALEKYNSLVFDPVNITVIDENNAILINEYEAEIVLALDEIIVLASDDILSISGAGAQFWTKKSGQWRLVHVSNISR